MSVEDQIATTSSEATTESLSTLPQELIELISLLWGTEVKPDPFQRWSQGGNFDIVYLPILKYISLEYNNNFGLSRAGFEFSKSEPTALVQHQGGPCAVIAPVQAYLLANLLAADSTTTKTMPLFHEVGLSLFFCIENGNNCKNGNANPDLNSQCLDDSGENVVPHFGQVPAGGETLFDGVAAETKPESGRD